TLQPRLLIPRDLSSADFQRAFDALDDQLRVVEPMVFGQGGPGLPYGVVPRNAAIRLTFSAPLGVTDDFFVSRDAAGHVTGLRNTEAVQLLRIAGDPTKPDAFVPLPMRVLVQDRSLVLDPVLLGTEGLQYQTANNAAGLPPSPDQLGANIRIAMALEGPLAIPGLREPDATGLIGANNRGRRSVVRDLRSGNANDTSADMARGFVRDPLPLRLIGEIVMYLERVENVNAFTQEVTVYKNGVSHEIDRGDVFRFLSRDSAVPLANAEVVVDPEDDRNQPANQHVRVRVRRVPELESLDPRLVPGYPATLAEREPWLVANAPKAVCIAEFTAGGRTENGIVVGDDPRYFLTFTATPLPGVDGTQPAANEFLPPFAGAVVRFTKPVDLATVRWADTLFFATRDLTSTAGIEQFIVNRPNNQGTLGMDPNTFSIAKYRTPHLIAARVFDEDGSQTTLRLQTTVGFYLDQTMRAALPGADYRYFLHLIANSPEGGIKDLSGNPVDLQGDTADRGSQIVIPFTVDTRMRGTEPFFLDNLAVSIVRRYAARDEDEMPSMFVPSEVQAPGASPVAATLALDDMFGAFVYLDGQLLARPASRTRVTADNVNQAPPGPQGTPLAWCPNDIFTPFTESLSSIATAGSVVPAGIQNPLNPFGCRLQTVWREVDLSLSRTNAFDFNLDIEQMYWAPQVGADLAFDELDSVRLFLGHAEYRPAPCNGNASAQPALPQSGLRLEFAKNFVWNPSPSGSGSATESAPLPHSAYREGASSSAPGTPMTINPVDIARPLAGTNRFLPLPAFAKPYFVYRDETVMEQGTDAGASSDLAATAYVPYITSPFAQGLGRRQVDVPGSIASVVPYWNDASNFSLNSPSTPDRFTGGLVGSIALPLLADFWTYCDSAELPLGNGFLASGANGWQTAVTTQSSPLPNFRVLSAGRSAAAGQGPLCVGTGQLGWTTATGGWAPPNPFVLGANYSPTIPGDNTFYWIMLDVVKRQSVMTAGFVDLNNPHRVPEGFADPRLGPFYLQNGQSTLPANVLPSFSYEFDPPLSRLPAGTSFVPQFRGASVVDPTPWYWNAWINTTTPLSAGLSQAARNQLRPTSVNFPLDPNKACDAHIRKWDTRPIPGSSSSRNAWTYFYNRTVTSYVEDANQLVDPAFAVRFGVPADPFTPRDIRYVNWRFVTSNNVEANPPVAPGIETFALSYRFTRQP
ncbi:MAG: hypothetical protein ABIP94_18465, partial [Planctomycetota bacterium]